MAIVTPRINQIKLSDGEHEIAARYLRDSSNGDHTYEDIVSLINAVGLELVIDSAKTGSATKEPATTAASTTQGKIYLVPDDSDLANGTYIEWVTVDKGSSANPRYVWEQIGTTAVDIQGLQTSSAGAQTVNTTSAGAQTATVSGSITYSKAPANTGNTAPGFTGTAATITSTGSYTPAGSIGGSQTVAAHSHTVNVSKDSATTFVTTAAIKSAALATTTATTGITVPVTLPTQAASAGGHTHSLNLTTDSAQTLVTTSAIKSAVLATTTAAVGTGVIQVVTGVNNAASAGAHTHSITPSTTAIYPAANVTAVTGVASNYGFASSTSNVMTAPTVSSAGVLSWTLASASTQAKASSTSSVRGTSVTVVNGVTETGSAGAHTHTVGASATEKLTVTTAPASTVSKQYVTGATTSTAGGVTISGSNFSFGGTAATITVKADYTPEGSVANHSHSITVANATASHSLSAAVSSHTHSVTVASHTHDIIKQS